MAFREAQTTVDRWISQYKEGYFMPLSNLARLIDLDTAFDAMMRKVTARDAARWTRKER